VELQVAEALAGRAVRQRGVHRQGTAGRVVGGAIGEQDASAARLDQQQRRGQQVEQRLVPAAARNCRGPLERLDE